MENEADSLGVAMFYLGSPYAKNVVEGVFDVLQYSALPFDDVPFDTTYFNTQYYTLNGCWLDKTAPITSRDDYDDKRSTHPNILSRRRKMGEAMDGYYGGEEFVMTTREEYMKLRDMARNECVRQELIGGEYSRAFYNAWVMMLEQKDGRSKYGEATAEQLAQALYGVAMFKNHNGTNSVTGDYKKVEGESQQVYYALRKMSNEQVVIAALHRIWQLHQQYPQNEAFPAMCADLIDELHFTNHLTLSSFIATPPETSADTADEPQEEKHLSKYERIKQKRQYQTQKSAFAHSLTDLQMSDSSFNKVMRSRFKAAKEESTDTTASEGGVFIYSSSYWVVNDKSGQMKVEKCQRGEQDLAEMVTRTGRRFGRESVDFTDRGLHQMETAEQYNDFVVLNEWVNEFWQNKGQFNLRRLTQPAMDDLMERYGATTVSVNALLDRENIKSSTAEHFAAAIILVPVIPIIAYSATLDNEAISMVTMVIDAAKGRVLSRQRYDADMDDNQSLVRSMLNDNYSRAFKGKGASGVNGCHVALMGGVQLAMPGVLPISKVATFTPWATAELALWPKGSIAVGWSHIGAFDEYNSEVRPEWVGYQRVNVLHENLDYSKAMTTLSLTYRGYSSGFAPMGPNWGVGAHMVLFTNPSDGSSGGKSFGVHLLAGRNYVFFDRLVLNIEARYGYTAGGIIIPSLSDWDKKDMHKLDAALHNLMQLRIGIGVLPF